jgi:hypothetical protein
MFDTKFFLARLIFLVCLIKVTTSVGLDWILGAPGSINELSHAEVLSMLSDKELIIIGDSVTRYQYMNLANFLHTGQWVSRYPQPESEKHWQDWKTYQILTNWRLGR